MTKRILELEHADEFRVEGKDASATGLKGGSAGVKRGGTKKKKVVGDLLRMRPRMFSRPERTESMPSSLSLRDGLRSPMASGRWKDERQEMTEVRARGVLTKQRAYHFEVAVQIVIHNAEENTFEGFVCVSAGM